MKRWHAYAVTIGIAALALGALVYWMHRPHTIVYRASGRVCDLDVTYSAGDGRTARARARERWQSEEVELVHGDVASLVVRAGRGCERVGCELVEDGVRVARARGTAVAICSAATAR